MKSQLLLIFLPIILIVAFLVGNLALSLSSHATIGQGNRGRHYFSLVNTRGVFFKENLLYVDNLLTRPYHAVNASMEWANQVVHVKIEPLDLWDSGKVYAIADSASDLGTNYSLRWMYPRKQPAPSAYSLYWEKYIIPTFIFGVFFPIDGYVISRLGRMFRRNTAAGTQPGGYPVDPESGPGGDNWILITGPIPEYDPDEYYYASYSRFDGAWVTHLGTAETNFFLEYSGSIVSFNGVNYLLDKSVPDQTTAPSSSPAFPDPLQNLDMWDIEPAFINLMDPRIPTDGTFFTVFNSPLSGVDSSLGIRWDRLIATVPLAFPPPRRQSLYSNALIDFEITLGAGEGVTVMNTANRFPRPNGSNAAGQFLHDEYNLLDRRWQIVRFMTSPRPPVITSLELAFDLASFALGDDYTGTDFSFKITLTFTFDNPRPLNKFIVSSSAGEISQPLITPVSNEYTFEYLTSSLTAWTAANTIFVMPYTIQSLTSNQSQLLYSLSPPTNIQVHLSGFNVLLTWDYIYSPPPIAPSAVTITYLIYASTDATANGVPQTSPVFLGSSSIMEYTDTTTKVAGSKVYYFVTVKHEYSYDSIQYSQESLSAPYVTATIP